MYNFKELLNGFHNDNFKGVNSLVPLKQIGLRTPPPPTHTHTRTQGFVHVLCSPFSVLQYCL